MILPFLHAALAGGWIACVLVEALFERALIGRGRVQEVILADLHWRVDMLVELPLLIAVAVSGAMLWGRAAPDGWFHAKLGFAGVAIAANLYCIGLVCARRRSARTGAWDAFERIDDRQHKVGALVLLALLAAFSLGLSRWG